MLNSLHPAVLVTGIVSMIALGILAAMYFEKKRTRQMLDAAGSLGFEPHTIVPDEFDGVFGTSQFLNLGRNRAATNIARRQVGSLDVVVCDYCYTVGKGKSTQTYNQTLVIFQSPRLQTPRFRLKPEGWLSKVGELFGGQDIDFDDSPEFSQKYVLAGDDEEAIRQFFNMERLHLLTRFARLCLESQPGSLLFWYDRRRTAPDDFKSFLDDAFSVFAALSNPE